MFQTIQAVQEISPHSILKRLFKDLLTGLERYSLAVCLGSFVLGIGLTRLLPGIGSIVSNGIESLLNLYAYVVPFLLYFLFTPSLLKIFDLSKKYGNGWLFSVLRQFALARFLAIVFVVVMLSLILGLPFRLNGEVDLMMALRQSLNQLMHALLFSPFLWGIYAAILTVFPARKISRIGRFFNNVGNTIEAAGQYFVFLSPLFMFAIASFLVHLPSFLEKGLTRSSSLGTQEIQQSLNLNLFGLQMLPAEYSFVGLYIVLGLMTGILCLAWHALYIVCTKIVQPKFRLRNYLKNYWVKIYPLLWSSSSESLAVPLSLNLMKKTFPYVLADIRQFVIAGGSYLGINGTIISVYVMGVVLAKALGVPVNFFQILASLPVIFILGFAVPGIPGELVIFAGAMSHLLAIPPEIQPLFLALYITLQIGLPDSFRTGCNSTDSALVAIMGSCKASLPARWNLKKRVHFSFNLFKRNLRAFSSYKRSPKLVNGRSLD